MVSEYLSDNVLCEFRHGCSSTRRILENPEGACEEKYRYVVVPRGEQEDHASLQVMDELSQGVPVHTTKIGQAL